MKDAVGLGPLGNTALIHITGTIKYSFYSNDETYTRC